jgi:3-oxoacyl-[acyl-carrier protein] reductase
VLTLEGRTALVTGGSRGIGRAVSSLLARLGAGVGVNYVRDETAARAVVAEIEANGGRARAVQADLSQPDGAERAISETVAAFGALDILVVNHGIWKRAAIESMTPAEWRETLQVNLDGAYAACHHAARVMTPRGSGAIVLIASTAGQRGEAFYSHYAASKGALIALTKSLAAELGPKGVRVNAVAPGWVLTDMTRAALEGEGAAEALRSVPLARPGTPAEIAGPVAFLASDLASFVFGEVLSANGGAVMTA